MTSRTTPINITKSQGHGLPRGPHSSNLSSALKATSGNEGRPNSAMDTSGTPSKGYGAGNGAASQHIDSSAEPISVKGSNREKPRRESLAGSMVTGMSWGGTSVGSWIRDDIIMQGTSPFAYQSPSFHSSSYLPKLEANFMKDFSCCGLQIPSLHDLLQHYEEVHAAPVPSGQKQSSKDEPRPDPKAAHANAAASKIQGGNGDPRKPAHLNTVGQGQGRPAGGDSAPPTPRQTQPAQNIMRGFAPSYSPPPQSSSTQDEDTVDDMELGDDFSTPSNNIYQPQDQIPAQSRINQRSQFGQPSSRVPPLNLNTSNIKNPVHQHHQGLRHSQPSTPVTAGRTGTFYQNNPTVSSVNTPTLTTYNNGAHPLQQQYYTPDSSAPGTPGEIDPSFVQGMQSMNMDTAQFMPNPYGNYPFETNNPMLDLYIDDPAKNLFAAGGFPDPVRQRQEQEQAPSSSASQLGDTQYSEMSPIAQTIRKVQKENGVPDPSADGVPKPFHCPVIGCEKAYKNQNGLKYHKSNGHKTQRLMANDNGTFSILDPETMKPYQGVQGMEKHKPYKCNNCGKRYKNLNGLKYHTQHSPPCSEGDTPTQAQPTNVVQAHQELADAMDL